MNDTAREFPTARQIVTAHRSVLQRIVDALLKGTAHARWYFVEMDDEAIDSGLAPALVRKGAKRALKESGADVQNEEEDNPQPDPSGEPEFLSNLGLAMRADGIRIRILRSDGGKVPVAGPSKRRRAFYSQQCYLPGMEPVEPILMPSPITHLVLHWETNDEYNLSTVYLALPTAGENTRDSVATEWNEIIWRRHVVNVDGDQAVAETIDLDIHLDGEQTGTA